MKGTYFVTGTDTEIGKTHAICHLLKENAKTGLSTLGLKPVAAGSEAGVNEDALLLQRYSSMTMPLDSINPFCFEEACSPHIAAKKEGVQLDEKRIADALSHSMSLKVDLCLIEGAGGWYAPLSDKISWPHLVNYLDIPVIFVIGMKLGCLNHAILTEKALMADGVTIKGWIANKLTKDMFKYQENLATLRSHLSSPLLEEIAYNPGLSSNGNDK